MYFYDFLCSLEPRRFAFYSREGGGEGGGGGWLDFSSESFLTMNHSGEGILFCLLAVRRSGYPGQGGHHHITA